MAVYTILSDDDILEIRNAFDLGEIIAFKGIAEGVSNSNYFIETTENRYILTIYEAMTEVADLPFYLGATEFAASKGLPTAKPIHTKTGEIIYKLGSKSCALCSFLKGISPKHPNVAQVRSAGVALAELHQALKDFPLKRQNSLGPSSWRPLWDSSKSQAEIVETGVSELIEADLDLIETNWAKAYSLPSGFIHADLFPDNVLFVGDEVSGLIDFYFGATDFWAYDIAVMLNAWCFLPLGREFDMTKGMALLHGYESVRPLSKDEKAAIPLLARGAALRFFLTRLSDWIKPQDGALVTKKDPREYSARLAFHRGAKSLSDYGIM